MTTLLRLRIAAALAAILTLLPAAARSAGELASPGMSVAIPIPFPQELTFCYGWNEHTQQCLLYIGSSSACSGLRSCTP